MIRISIYTFSIRSSLDYTFEDCALADKSKILTLYTRVYKGLYKTSRLCQGSVCRRKTLPDTVWCTVGPWVRARAHTPTPQGRRSARGTGRRLLTGGRANTVFIGA